MDFANYWFSNTGNPDMGDPFGPPGRTRSLGFDIDNDYLRLQGLTTTSGTPYTMSFWFKPARQSEGARQYLVSSTSNFFVEIAADLRLTTRVGGTAYVVPGPVYIKDHGGWYHFYMTKPSGTGNDGELYLNGHQLVGARIPYLRNSSASWIWMRSQTTENYWTKGGICNIHFVVGSQVGIEEFGEFNSKGIWINKQYTGTHGSGASIDFGATDPSNPLLDTSGNGLAWDAPRLELVDTTDNNYALRYDDPLYNYATLGPNQESAGRVNGWIPSKYFNADRGQGGDGSNIGSYYNASNFYASDTGTYYWEDSVYTGNNGSTYIGLMRDDYKSGVGPSLRDNATIYKYNSGTISFPGSGYNPANRWTLGNLMNLDTGEWTYRNAVGGTGGDIGTHNLYSDLEIPRDLVHQQKMAIGVAMTAGGKKTSLNWGQKPYNNPPAGVSPETHGCHSQNITPPIVDSQSEFRVISGPGATILDEAKAVFPKGLWWIKDKVNKQNWQIVDSIAPTTAHTSPTVSYVGYTPPAGESIAFCWNVGTDPVPMNGGTINANVAANKKAGFSMGTYVGNGQGTQTFEHGLDEAPNFVIIHQEGAGTIMMYHDQSGGNYFYRLNQYNGRTSSGQAFRGNDATTIGIGNFTHVNTSGTTYHFWAWHTVPGFSHFGRTYGNGTYFQDTQFDPAMVMAKRIEGNGHYSITTKHSSPINPIRLTLATSLNNGERAVSNTEEVMHYSSGFNFLGSDGRISSTCVTMAWAHAPYRAKGEGTPTAR